MIRFHLMLAGMLLCSIASAQEKQPPLPLFSHDSVLHLRIEADWKTLLRTKNLSSPDELPAVLVHRAGTDTMRAPIQIRVRGNYRRTHCPMPPLRMRFDTAVPYSPLFAGLEKVKLVLPCEPDKPVFQQYLVEEYLLYRMFRILTDSSFRVRLLSIDYVDPSGRMKPFSHLGFCIEPEDALARRLGMFKVEKEGVHGEDTERRYATLMYVFQYLIGNTDWSVPGLHNIAVLQGGLFGQPIAVPYDFDWSGIIDAPYALPNEQLNIGTVRQRLYRGYCREEAELQQAFDVFRQHKAELFELYRSTPQLKPERAEQAVRYLEQFYELIDNPKQVEREFIRNCRRRGS
ncbi:MAG: hypothetical protein NW241_20595 [Bacteroidia bacterium]|nr:hypothetical protein [Bacteroidia bacterium]